MPELRSQGRRCRQQRQRLSVALRQLAKSCVQPSVARCRQQRQHLSVALIQLAESRKRVPLMQQVQLIARTK